MDRQVSNQIRRTGRQTHGQAVWHGKVCQENWITITVLLAKRLETTKWWQCSWVILTLSYLILLFGSIAEGKLRNWTNKSEKSGLSPYASKLCCIKLLCLLGLLQNSKQQTSPQHKAYAYEETDVDIWQQLATVGKPANTKLTKGKNSSHSRLTFFMCSSLMWKTCKVNYPKEHEPVCHSHW